MQPPDGGMASAGGGPRVVSLLPSATDTLVALGMARLLVGRSHEVRCKLIDTGTHQKLSVLSFSVACGEWDSKKH